MIICRCAFGPTVSDPIIDRMEARKPDGYLIITNISKNHNIGNMIRSACAFGMKEVCSILLRDV